MRGGDAGGVAAANTSGPVISVCSCTVGGAYVLCSCGFHISPNLSQVAIDTWGVKWMPVPAESIHEFKHDPSKAFRTSLCLHPLLPRFDSAVDSFF